jgi:hypothetical protein
MMPTFAYSFDRDTYHGAFPTRQAALDAALKALRDRSDQPEGIFVGQWIEPNPCADGHADRLIECMRDRWLSSPEAQAYLDDVTEQQAADLDTQIDHTIRAWLNKHGLFPKAVKVRAVSEHPVPNVNHVAVTKGERETSLMGEA